MPMSHPNARCDGTRSASLAICIIGDEVLNGKTQDSNSHFVARRAFTLGLDLKEIRVIKDTEDDIISTVRSLSFTHDIVFTSGGIGPTHDDLTYPSIAKAFDKDLVFMPSVAERIVSIKRIPKLNTGQLRMCTVPSPDEDILFTEGLWQPIVCVKNVYIFPGVPGLFTRMVDNWMKSKGPRYELRPMKRLGIRTDMQESVVSETLESYNKKVLPLGWTIGSYPKKNFESGKSWVEISMIGPFLAYSEDRELMEIIEGMKKEYLASDLEFE